MTAMLDHTIVPVKDQDESVEFYTRVLGFQYDGRAGMDDRFAVIRLNESFTLDLQRFDVIPDPGIHYAFALERSQFDQAFQAIKDAGIPFGDGPRDKTNMRGPGISTGAKGETLSVYFADPSGHRLEILTYA